MNYNNSNQRFDKQIHLLYTLRKTKEKRII